MKLKVFMVCLVSLFCLSANATRIHPAHVKSVVKQKGLTVPGKCEIELVNLTHQPVYVQVGYDDGGQDNTMLYPNDPLYIDLWYPQGRYCQRGARVYIETQNGRPIFNQYVYDGQSVTVDPLLLNQNYPIVKLK
jgi:hypothetical protein